MRVFARFQVLRLATKQLIVNDSGLVCPSEEEL